MKLIKNRTLGHITDTMNYSLDFIFCIFISVIDFGVSTNPCPNKSRNYNPEFSIDPPFSLSGIESKYFCMECCFNGFNKILWDFKQFKKTEWNSYDNEWNLNNSNQTLCVISPKRLINNGHYRCTATDTLNNSSSHSIFVYFLLNNKDKNLTLISTQMIPRSDYKIGNDLILSCKAESFKPSKAVSIRWLHSKLIVYENISRSHYISNSIITGFNQTVESNPDIVEVFTNFSLYHLQLADNGTYKCVIEQDGTTVEQIFFVLITDDRINWILLVFLLIVTLVTLTSLAVAWTNRFDILVMYKTYFDMFLNKNEKEYDLSIIHQDDDMVSSQIAVKIVSNMENRNFHCWLFDRDKIYGQEILVDYSRILTHSHSVLIFVSLESVRNDELLSNLSSIQCNPSVRRLYIWNPSKKIVLKAIQQSNPSVERFQIPNKRNKSPIIFSSFYFRFELNRKDKL